MKNGVDHGETVRGYLGNQLEDLRSVLNLAQKLQNELGNAISASQSLMPCLRNVSLLNNLMAY